MDGLIFAVKRQPVGRFPGIDFGQLFRADSGHGVGLVGDNDYLVLVEGVVLQIVGYQDITIQGSGGFNCLLQGG